MQNHSHCHPQHNQHHKTNHSHAHDVMLGDFKKRFWISLAVTIPILLLSPMIQHFFGLQSLHFFGDRYLLFILSSFIFFYGGWPFLVGLVHELKAKAPGMMTLIGLAISIAYIYSTLVVFGLEGEDFFWELATLVVIMLLGHWIEMQSVMGASKALEELARLLPGSAHKILPDGTVQEIRRDALEINDHFLVKPGEKIPADGNIIQGTSSVNEAMLTGESLPVTKNQGNSVLAGSINVEGSLIIEVKKREENSYLAQMMRLVKEALGTKSKTQNLANRAAFWLTLIALGAGLITLIVWFIILRSGFSFALERTVTVMVITCPHALGLAIPLVVAISTALGAKNGLLIRNRAAFEQARNIQAIIFDKTGTLTQGVFGVTDVYCFDPTMTQDNILNYAASIEAHSEHPIAKGIVAKALQKYPMKNFKALIGEGVEGVVGEKTIKVISPRSLKQQVPFPMPEGKTVVYVLMDDVVIGAIANSDLVRPEAQEAISALKNMHIQCIMITGDGQEVAKQVADTIGIDIFFAEVTPQEKVHKVKEIQNQGLIVGMVGDGVNDAPALAQADVGIAIGAGTDVAQETADIILVKNNPMDVVHILQLARATYSKMVQNLAWATGYNLLSLPIAAGVLAPLGILLSPAIGAILMSLSTVIVAINARLLKI